MIALRAAFLAFALAATGHAQAQGSDEPVAKFYEALKTADADQMDKVLADDAVIRLADLGFDMTKDEFVDSMSEWETVAQSMTMRVKPDPDRADTDETVVRLVCYKFPSNTSLTRETSTVVDGRITANMQEEVAESCEDF